MVVNRVSGTGLANGRLQPGDLITSVNRNDIRTSTDFRRHLVASAGVQGTTIAFYREGRFARTDLPAVPRKEE